MRIARAAMLGLALVSALASRAAVETADADRASLIAPAPGDNAVGGLAPAIAWAAILPIAPAADPPDPALVATAPAGPPPAPAAPAPLRFAPKTSPPRT
jgi:hypothetical protein